MAQSLVLFVDDDEKILHSWKRNFCEEPFSMLFANSAAQAISIMNRNQVSIVVSDYSMPKVTGLELFSHIQENFPNVVRILVSGQATLKVAQEAINIYGIYKLFEKPCSTLELGLAIKDALSWEDSNKLEDSQLLVLEKRHPGITQVKRSASGAIEI